MLMYAKIIDEQTNEVSVGLGDDIDFYKSIGMTEQEVEKAYNGSWYLKGFAPQKPLDELKEEKREEINTARNAAEQGGFPYMGKVFDSDPISCIRISSAAQAMQTAAMAEDVPVITWTCQDNTTIDLTSAELLGLVVALAEWSNTCHQKATVIKGLLDKCQTPEEVEKISWDMELDVEEPEPIPETDLNAILSK